MTVLTTFYRMSHFIRKRPKNTVLTVLIVFYRKQHFGLQIKLDEKIQIVTQCAPDSYRVEGRHPELACTERSRSVEGRKSSIILFRTGQ